MGSVFMKSRGQISIEFILIMLIALVYIYTVIQPTIQIAADSSDDVTRFSQTKLAAQKIATAVSQVGAAEGNAKKTISVLVPRNSVVDCCTVTACPDPNTINFSVETSGLRNPAECPNDTTCSGSIEYTASSLSCLFNTDGKIAAGENNILRKVVVSNSGSGIVSVNYVSS